jgi:16S rRNA processing protein RimM
MDLDQQNESTSEKVVLGRITGVYGLKGWVKVFSFTDPMESIVDYSPWYIRPEAGNTKSRQSSPWTRVKLKAGKRHAKTVIAKLEHCNDCDEAQAYIGFEIAIEQSQLDAQRDDNEFYWRDLIGLQVVNQQNIELGVVTKLMETGANDVLVVTSEEEAGTGSKERLIPWTLQQAIIAVDLEQGVIEVDWDPDF